MRRNHPILIAAAAAALGAGCDVVDSSTVTTAEMGLFVDIQIDDDGVARAVAQLTTDNDALLEQTYIRLAPGDTLSISAGGVTREMREEVVVPLNLTQYAASIDGMASGDRIEVSLEREADDDAPRSRIVVPDEFSIASPGNQFSRRDGIEIAWSSQADADQATVLVSGACFESITERFDGNPGRTALSSRDFVAADRDAACAATIEVRLTNSGDVDRHYGRGGTISAHQRRLVELTASP